MQEDKISRMQRREYRRVNSQITSLWDNFRNDVLSTMQLLQKCAQIYGPSEESSPAVESDDSDNQ